MIELKAELAGNLPEITGADNEIRDAITDLIFNAVDATPNGGVITVRSSVPKMHAQDGPAARRVLLEVIDSGVGMDEGTRRRCLEPFFTTKGERGTGLGLAMVFGMAQRHGATLEIDSRLGAGTTMRILFPSASEAPAVAAGVPAQQGPEPFDVVITDLGMPYVDGRQVAAAVRAMAAHTPIIPLTGWGQRMAPEHEVPQVNRVLGKPPRLRELRAALAELTAAPGPSPDRCLTRR